MSDEDPARHHGLLGKKPVDAAARRMMLSYSSILNMEALPKPPAFFGHYKSLPSDLGMLGNDTAGNCVWAGFDHHVMYWNCAAGRTNVTFTDANAIGDYSAFTGYRSWNPLSDQGTDMSTAPNYFRDTGVVDANGNRHKIDAVVSLELGNLDELKQAMFLFEGAGIGLNLPDSAPRQFDAGHVWTVVPGSGSEGGHYVAGFGFNSHGNIVVGTWGRLQALTPSFWNEYGDEVQIYLSLESLDAKGFSADQFDRPTLVRYLASLHRSA